MTPRKPTPRPKYDPRPEHPQEARPEDRTPEDSPTAWFAVLERAMDTFDTATQRRALAELKRLGVTLHFKPGAFPRSRPGKGEGADHAE